MILTKHQEEGLKIAVERYKNHKPYTVIAGYAGSGKSTLIKFIISALNVNPEEDVSYVAFTGKAAAVLQSKGCPNATTAHKLLYKAKPMPSGTYKFTPRAFLEKQYKVIVVDEISMLPKPMWDLLLSHNIYILAAGDPGQLPPVDKSSYNHILDNPHIFLNEIMRQAQDSEIIRLSMWIREGKPLDQFHCENKQVRIFNKSELVSGMYNWADQVLCSSNKHRIAINNFIRSQKNLGPHPTKGDKVISLRNHWEYYSDKNEWPLTNGVIGSIGYNYVEEMYVPRYISIEPIKVLYADVALENGDKFSMVPIDYNAIATGISTLDDRQQYLLRKNKHYIDPPFDFTYGYAITVHKAQGSEWDNVLIEEETSPYVVNEHRQWLYTAITRAKEKLVIIKK